MARVTGSVLGNLSGRLGNLSARTRNGKTYLAARPGPRTDVPTPAALAIRQKFAVTIAIVKSVLELPALKAIWAKAKDPDISAANTIFRDNFDLVSTNGPTNQNIITPGGFDFDVVDPAVTPNSVTGDIAVLNNKAVFSTNDKDLEIDAVVCYYNPVDPADPAYSLMNFSTVEAGCDFAANNAFIFNCNINQQNIAEKYQNSILYLAVATKDIDGKIVQYSSTLAIES